MWATPSNVGSSRLRSRAELEGRVPTHHSTHPNTLFFSTNAPPKYGPSLTPSQPAMMPFQNVSIQKSYMGTSAFGAQPFWFFAHVTETKKLSSPVDAYPKVLSGVNTPVLQRASTVLLATSPLALRY